MLGFLRANLGTIVWGAIVVIVIVVIGYVGYGCGARSRDDDVAELAAKLSQSEQTIELAQGLYVRKIEVIDGLNKLLDTSREEMKALQKQLDDSKAQLLTTQQLVIKWKKAYEGAVDAHQTEPEPGRKRVDFTKDFGPIGVTGHTLTDPPEGFISVRQLRPLKLTVSVAKNRDGTWASYVTSSEPDMAVDVSLGGVDTGIIAPTWRQRIWIEGGVDLLSGRRVSLGASYRFDRVALGAGCSVWESGQGCGLTVGYRLFK